MTVTHSQIFPTEYKFLENFHFLFECSSFSDLKTAINVLFEVIILYLSNLKFVWGVFLNCRSYNCCKPEGTREGKTKFNLFFSSISLIFSASVFSCFLITQGLSKYSAFTVILIIHNSFRSIIK